jgi:hypothetical protein
MAHQPYVLLLSLDVRSTGRACNANFYHRPLTFQASRIRMLEAKNRIRERLPIVGLSAGASCCSCRPPQSLFLPQHTPDPAD